MNRFSKKMLTGILSAALVFQPAAFLQEGNVIIAEAHSGRTDGSGGHQ